MDSILYAIYTGKQDEEDVTFDINGRVVLQQLCLCMVCACSDYMEAEMKQSRSRKRRDRWGLYYGVKAMAKDKDRKQLSSGHC